VGGNALLLGGAAKRGQVLGNYPADLTELDVGNGRLIPTTFWEGLWKGVAEWMGVTEAAMAKVLPNLGAFDGTGSILGQVDMFE